MSPLAEGAAREPLVYLDPIGIHVPDSVSVGPGLPFLGGPRRFLAVRRLTRQTGGVRAEIATVGDGHQMDGLDALSAPRPALAGLVLDRPHVMAIVNVTPDSFSDGGRHYDAGRAVDAGLAFREAGAAIVDVGGESTRPGAHEVDPREEARRVVPVVRGLADAGVLVSVDTRHAQVMAAALQAGARLINDVSALAHDPEGLGVAANSDAAIILTHMQGIPETMQDDPRYEFAPLDIFDALATRISACEAAGIARHRLAVDPGIGFGKLRKHNDDILRHLALFHGLGCAVALGASRKLRAKLPGLAHGEHDRLAASLAAAIEAARKGAHIIRVHDVAETRQVLDLLARMEHGPPKD